VIIILYSIVYLICCLSFRCHCIFLANYGNSTVTRRWYFNFVFSYCSIVMHTRGKKSKIKDCQEMKQNMVKGKQLQVLTIPCS